jgi:hypothetical protein
MFRDVIRKLRAFLGAAPPSPSLGAKVGAA